MMDATLLRDIRDLQDRLARLERADMRGTIAVRYTSSTGEAIAHNTLTVVNFATQAFDDLGLVQTGTAWQFTAPVAGIYAVQAIISFDSAATWAESEVVALYVYKNAERYAVLDRIDRDTTSAALTRMVTASGMTLVPLAADDTVNIQVTQTSGAVQVIRVDDTRSYVSIWRI